MSVDPETPRQKPSNLKIVQEEPKQAPSVCSAEVEEEEIPFASFGDDLPAMDVATGQPEKPGKRARTYMRTGPLKAENHGRRKPLSEADLDAQLEVSGAPRTDEQRALVEQRQAEPGKRFRPTREALEYRRKQILRLLLRGVPKETIAQYLGMDVKQVYEDVKAINADMRQNLHTFDYPSYISMSLAFYEEARMLALRTATDQKEKSNNTKMNSLRVAMEAQQNIEGFLQKIGLFKIVAPTDPLHDIQTGRSGSFTDENDIGKFLQLIAEVLPPPIEQKVARDG